MNGKPENASCLVRGNLQAIGQERWAGHPTLDGCHLKIEFSRAGRIKYWVLKHILGIDILELIFGDGSLQR